jgi:hypothetical protein
LPHLNLISVACCSLSMIAPWTWDFGPPIPLHAISS